VKWDKLPSCSGHRFPPAVGCPSFSPRSAAAGCNPASRAALRLGFTYTRILNTLLSLARPAPTSSLGCWRSCCAPCSAGLRAAAELRWPPRSRRGERCRPSRGRPVGARCGAALAEPGPSRALVTARSREGLRVAFPETEQMRRSFLALIFDKGLKKLQLCWFPRPLPRFITMRVVLKYSVQL